jgi:outer membrane protein
LTVRSLLTFALALMAGFALPVRAVGPDSGAVRFVDLDKVFNEYYKTKLADAQLKEQAEEFNQERAKLVESYEAMQKEFNEARDQSSSPALSDDARNKLRSQAEEKLIEIREQEQKIRNFDNSRRKQLEEQGRRMRKRIVDEIREKVQAHAKSKGYLTVVDTSGQSLNGVAIVLYVDEKADITADMIASLNKDRTDTSGTRPTP